MIKRPQISETLNQQTSISIVSPLYVILFCKSIVLIWHSSLLGTASSDPIQLGLLMFSYFWRTNICIKIQRWRSLLYIVFVIFFSVVYHDTWILLYSFWDLVFSLFIVEITQSNVFLWKIVFRSRSVTASTLLLNKPWRGVIRFLTALFEWSCCTVYFLLQGKGVHLLSFLIKQHELITQRKNWHF